MGWKRLILALAALSCLPTASLAGGVESCGTSRDSTLQTSAVQSSNFSWYRRGQKGFDLTARDIEFQWDPLYSTSITQDVRSTLDAWQQVLGVTTGLAPLATDANTLQAVYNYFRQRGSDWNTLNPSDSLAFRMGKGQDGATGPYVSQYTNADRSHVDTYVVHPSQTGFGGSYPSHLDGPNEDASTGHAAGEVLHRNSIMVAGPWGNGLDVSGSGWTNASGYRRLNFAHELNHGLPGAGTDPAENGNTDSGSWSELWSAGAEAVVGIKDTTGISGEVPYTWPMIENYQLRTSFMAYVAYNFLNQDQNRTLSGMRDDMLYRWSRGDRRLTGLRDRLTDDSCWTCQQKTYFHPNGQALSKNERIALLMHNWRVATFVNNPALAEGQYGFPAWSGFSPGPMQRAWQDFDNLGNDDVVAIPAKVIVGPRQALRETTFAYQRSFRGGTEPLILMPTGSNYWVIRADPALWTQDRDLVIRVSPRNRYLDHGYFPDDPRFPPTHRVRLMASTASYNTDDPGDETDLWKKPGSVTAITPATWVDTDSLCSDLEVVVPNFGLTNKSVVLVLSLGDAVGDWLSDAFIGHRAQSYRLDVSLRTGASEGQAPVAFSATAGANEDYAAWSPDGDELVFMATLPQFANRSQIYRKKLDGTGLALLAPQVNGQYAPDWSPRGNLIAFEGVTALGDSRIWMANLDTPWNPVYDVSNLPGVETMPVFQPDGQGVAFIHIPPNSTTWELRWASQDGTGSRVVSTFPAVNTYSPRPAWNPTGTRIYLSLNDTLYSVPVSGGSLTRDTRVTIPARWVDFHRGNGRVLTESRMEVPNFAAFFTNPIQMANRIALYDSAAARRDTSFRYAVRYPAESRHPRYSPDGTRIAFTQFDASGSADIYVGRVTPNHAPVLSPIEDRSEPACVPLEFTISATDPDGEPVTYRADLLPPGAVLVGSTFRWLSPVVGDYFVIFRALDGSSGVACRVVHLSIFDDGSCYEALAEGGSGGGGFSARSPQTTRLFPTGSPTPGIANSLLDGASPDQWVDQLARLMTPVVDEAGACHTQLVARLAGTTTLDRVQLIAVDHPASLTVFATPGGMLVGGTGAATDARDESGNDLMERLGSDDPSGVVVQPAQTLDVSLAGDTSEAILVDCQRVSGSLGEAESGIEAQAFVDGAWRALGRIQPRLKRDILAIPTESASTVRLRFLSGARVFGLAGLVSDETALAGVAVQTMGPAATEPTEAIDVVSGNDGEGQVLGNSQTLSLTYAPTPVPDGMVRSYFLSVRAKYSLTPLATSRSATSGEEVLPTRFAFSPGSPNPFERSTQLRFDLPRSSHVRLEAFDILGRRVRLLADAEFAAGSHSISWDGSGDAGGATRPGVYLVRMTAEGFRAQQRVVRLGQ